MEYPFVKGMVLAERLYHEGVKPVMERRFPDVCYSAARLGRGSDTLGYDTPISMDHAWGPEVEVYLPPGDYAQYVGVKWLWDTSERLVSLPGTTMHSTIWDRKERYGPTQARLTGPRYAQEGGQVNACRTTIARSRAGRNRERDCLGITARASPQSDQSGGAPCLPAYRTGDHGERSWPQRSSDGRGVSRGHTAPKRESRGQLVHNLGGGWLPGYVHVRRQLARRA